MFIRSTISCSQFSKVFSTALLRGEVTGRSVTRTACVVYKQQQRQQIFVFVYVCFKEMLGRDTCEVKTSYRNEVLDIVMCQFHHDQANQCPAVTDGDKVKIYSTNSTTN